jgi:DNA-binding LacI/PurR family transcriptional regulator
MNDVALAAGVAQSTVSRILNDAPVTINVSPETRERVRAIARELGYRPHPIARALRGAPTMLLGAVVRDITDPFFAGAIEALSVQAKARGYSVVLGHAGAKADEALALAAVLEARQCDAIVLLGDFRSDRRLLEDLRSAQVRVVGLWHGSERRGRPFPTVGVDNRAGIKSALAHLFERGHRRIAYVGAESLGDMKERYAAYVERTTPTISPGLVRRCSARTCSRSAPRSPPRGPRARSIRSRSAAVRTRSGSSSTRPAARRSWSRCSTSAIASG